MTVEKVSLSLDPDKPDVLANRAAALAKLKRYPEAIEACEQALAHDPNNAAAMRELIHCRLNSCDWRCLPQEKGTIAAALDQGKRKVQPFDNLTISVSEGLNRVAAELWVADECPPQPQALWRGERYRHDKIRIGYLSTDLRAHAVAFLIVGVFIAGSNSQEIVPSDNWYGWCIDDAGCPDPTTHPKILDVYVGRLPVTSLAQAQGVIHKLVQYEHVLPTDTWRRRMVLQSDDDYSGENTFGGSATYGYCQRNYERIFEQLDEDCRSVILDDAGLRQAEPEVLNLGELKLLDHDALLDHALELVVDEVDLVKLPADEALDDAVGELFCAHVSRQPCGKRSDAGAESLHRPSPGDISTWG
jgi:tetratricopeptide (TPR) repeat protein